MWATMSDLTLHMGIPEDARMSANLDEALAWAHRKRPDLDPHQPQGASVRKAVCIYAGLLYRERSSAQGITGYDLDGGSTEDSTAYYRALDMLGVRRPKAC